MSGTPEAVVVSSAGPVGAPGSVPSAPEPPRIDPDAVYRFVATLTGHEDTPCTWQMFHDAARGGGGRVYHGPLELVGSRLEAMQRQGHGVFVTVSETDLQGRKACNIVRPRAVFVEMDGGLDIGDWHIPPAMIVRSKNGPHAYWLVDPSEPLDGLRPALQALAIWYRTDPAVATIERVLRVPGFLHQKREPFLVRLEHVEPSAARLRFADVMPGAAPSQPEWKSYLDWNLARRLLGKHGSTVALPDFADEVWAEMSRHFGVWRRHVTAFMRSGAAPEPFDPNRFLPAPQVRVQLRGRAGGGARVRTGARTGGMDWSSLDIIALFRDAGLLLSGPESPDGWVTVRCPWAHEHSSSHSPEAGIRPATAGAGALPGFNCFHAHGDLLGLDDVRQALGADLFDSHCSLSSSRVRHGN